jgi:hypothetical protein
MSDDHAKTGHAADDHGHTDDHGHEVAADFIAETSGYDKLVGLFAILAGVGLIAMMLAWGNAAMTETATEHEGFAPPVQQQVEQGGQQTQTQEHR